MKKEGMEEFRKHYKPRGLFLGRGRFEKGIERHYRPRGMSWFWKLVIFVLIVLFFLYIAGKLELVLQFLK